MPNTPNTNRANTKPKQPKRDHRSQSAKQALPSAVVAADQARHQAVQMRIAGHSFRDIADAMNVSISTAYKYVNDGWQRINELTDDDRRKLRHQEAERLNEAQVVVMELIRAPGLVVEFLDRKGNAVTEDGAMLKLRAIDRLVKIAHFRADLFGYKLVAPKDAENMRHQEPFIPLDKLAAMVEAQQAQAAAEKANPVIPINCA